MAANPSARQRAAIYARVSVSRDESVSVPAQIAECRKLIRRAGWTHDPQLDTFVDEGKSASKKEVDRPSFRAMMAAVEAGQYKRIVVWKLDRLTRRAVEWYNTNETLKSHGVSIHSVRDGIDTAGGSTLLVGILAGIAEQEANTIRDRVENAQAEMFLDGRWAGGPAPYGWRKSPHPGGKGLSLVLEPAQADVMRRAVQLVSGGEGIAATARRLNQEGRLAGREGPWSAQALRKCLTRRVLIGQHEVAGKVSRNPATGEEIVPHEPLITVAEWLHLQQCIEARALAKPHRAGQGAMLTGLARCGLCGGRMHGADCTNNPKANYRCRAAYELNKDCAGTSIRAAVVEAFVADAILERLGEHGNIPVTEESWRAGLSALSEPEDAARMEYIRREMKNMRAERQRQTGWAYAGAEADWQEMYQRFGDELTQLSEKREAQRAARPVEVYIAWKDKAEAERTWRRLNQQDRRNTARGMIERVVINPPESAERIRIEWRTDVFHRPPFELPGAEKKRRRRGKVAEI